VNAFAAHGVPDTIKFWAEIDVKKHQITKPIMHQRAIYSGHKRIHCMKYQTFGVSKQLNFTLQHWRQWSSRGWLCIAQKWTNPFFMSALNSFW
jgi:hypothetical protein